MNTAVENLNLWGAQLAGPAGAMLWQSTLLGLVILLLDSGLRPRSAPVPGRSNVRWGGDMGTSPGSPAGQPGCARDGRTPEASGQRLGWRARFQLRASVRYGLWLVLLLKLVLPPSLALPTGAVWWWSSATQLPPMSAPAPAPAPSHWTTTVVVSQDDAPMSDLGPLPAPETAPASPPRPALTPAAWGLLAVGMVSLGLLGWVLCRWRLVARTARTAESDPAFGQMLAEACRLAKGNAKTSIQKVEMGSAPAPGAVFRALAENPAPTAKSVTSAGIRTTKLLASPGAFVLPQGGTAAGNGNIHPHPAPPHEPESSDCEGSCGVSRRRGIAAFKRRGHVLSLIRAIFHHPSVPGSTARISAPGDNSPSPKGEGRGEGEHMPAMSDHRPFASIQRFTARIFHSGKSLPQKRGDVPQSPPFSSNLRVKITRETVSPAVCGLFRPVILLPQALTETLSPEQLRAVLLHELMHVRRGDVWVNCAQALLQIVYWWNPMVWVANARLRRLREEAVDDAVVAALREDADVYAPTLLAVAKFAFHRPLASLGLVGILESRSALRQRIERLVNFPPPRRAGLGLVSVFGLLVFSAVAVPMGDAPPLPPAPDRPATVTNNAVGPAAAAPQGGTAAEPSSSTNEPAGSLSHPDTNAAAVSGYIPPGHNPYDQPGLVYTGPGRHEIVNKLFHLHLGKVAYDRLPLTEVLKELSAQVKSLDPQQTGINFVINPNPNLSAGLAAAAQLDPDSVLISFSLSDVDLVDVMDALVLLADHPIQYSVLDYGIVFSARPAGVEPLTMRNFKVNGDVFMQGLESVGSAGFGVGGNGNGSGLGGGGNSGGNGGGTAVPVVNISPGAAQVRSSLGGAGAGGNLGGPADYLNQPAPPPTAPAASTPPATTTGGPARNLSRPADHKLSAVEDANNQAVLRQAETVSLRQKLVAAANAEQAGQMAGAAKLYQEAADLVEQIGAGIDPETTMTAAGLARTRLSLAREAETHRDFSEAARQIGLVLKYDPKNPAALVLKQENDTLIKLYDQKKPEAATPADPPAPTTTHGPAGSPSHPAALNGAVVPANAPKLEANTLVQNGKLYYGMGRLDEAETNLLQAAKLNPDNTAAPYYLQLVQQERIHRSATNHLSAAPTNFNYTSSGRQRLADQLNRIHLDSVTYDHLPLREVLRQLARNAHDSDPNHIGVNFMINPHPNLSDPAATDTAEDVGGFLVNLTLTNATLAEVLDAVVKGVDHPIQYSIVDYAVIFSPKVAGEDPLVDRTFQVDATTVQNMSVPENASLPLNFKNYFQSVGINLGASGRLVFYSARFRLLTVRATPAELDEVRAALDALLNPAATNAPLVDHTFRLEAAVVKKMMDAAGINNLTGTQSDTAVGPGPGTSGHGNTAGAADALGRRRPSMTRSIVEENVKNYFATMGINLDEQGKAFFYGDEPGLLMVRATPAELNRIGPALDAWNVAATNHAGANFFVGDAPPFAYVTRTYDDGDYSRSFSETYRSMPPVSVPVSIPMLHIKARFIEVEPGDQPGMGFNWYLGQFSNSAAMTGSAPALRAPPADKAQSTPSSPAESGPAKAAITGILSGTNLQTVIRALENRPGAEILGEPEVTTVGGRQTQMRATELQTILTGINPKALTPPGISSFEVTNGAGLTNGTFLMKGEPCETGPTFDVRAQVLPDGVTIHLEVIASDVQFHGYDKPTNSVTVYVEGRPQKADVPNPRFTVRALPANLNIYDGQTVILGSAPEARTGEKPKQLLVLATVIIVDPAGNRVHMEGDLPSGSGGLPAPEQTPAYRNLKILQSMFGGHRSDSNLDDRPFDQEGHNHGF